MPRANAIESYSRSAAAEMGNYGITISIVAPGPIQTGASPDQVVDIAEDALGQVGEPSNVSLMSSSSWPRSRRDG